MKYKDMGIEANSYVFILFSVHLYFFRKEIEKIETATLNMKVKFKHEH